MDFLKKYEEKLIAKISPVEVHGKEQTKDDPETHLMEIIKEFKKSTDTTIKTKSLNYLAEGMFWEFEYIPDGKIYNLTLKEKR